MDFADNGMPPLEYFGIEPRRLAQLTKVANTKEERKGDEMPSAAHPTEVREATPFKEGDNVVLVGLTQSPFDGQQGKVMSQSHASVNRVAINLCSLRKKVMAKPENLRRIKTTAIAPWACPPPSCRFSLMPLEHDEEIDPQLCTLFLKSLFSMGMSPADSTWMDSFNGLGPLENRNMWEFMDSIGLCNQLEGAARVIASFSLNSAEAKGLTNDSIYSALNSGRLSPPTCLEVTEGDILSINLVNATGNWVQGSRISNPTEHFSRWESLEAPGWCPRYCLEPMWSVKEEGLVFTKKIENIGRQEGHSVLPLAKKGSYAPRRRNGKTHRQVSLARLARLMITRELRPPPPPPFPPPPSPFLRGTHWTPLTESRLILVASRRPRRRLLKLIYYTEARH